MHPNIVDSTQPVEMFVIDTQMQNVDADLTRKMKRYHEKNKQFVQQPVLVSQVCAYRLVTFLQTREGRADRGGGDWRGEENNTRNIHQDQGRVVC